MLNKIPSIGRPISERNTYQSLLREELERMVVTDHLTKLNSRSFLHEKMTESMERDEEGVFMHARCKAPDRSGYQQQHLTKSLNKMILS